jgi:hypothetical protein
MYYWVLLHQCVREGTFILWSTSIHNVLQTPELLLLYELNVFKCGIFCFIIYNVVLLYQCIREARCTIVLWCTSIHSELHSSFTLQ